MASPSFRAVRPDASEYAPYYSRYIDALPEGDVLALLESQGRETARLLADVDPARGGFRYAPGKWCLNEVVGHVCDVERIFALRALAFARGERARLFGMEQDGWAAGGRFAARTLPSLAEELAAVRTATLCLFRGLDEAAWGARGVAAEVEFTVRSIPWVLAGHERHHVGVIRERYLAGA